MLANYDNSGSSRQFGKQWHLFDKIDPQHEKQFNGWTSAAPLDFFCDTTLLDAGCGNGRNSYWAAQKKPKTIVAIDLDELSINVAKKNNKNIPIIDVRLMSIYDVNNYFPNYFDSIMCIGVLHHLAFPDLALQAFNKSLKSDGRLLLWVYGRYGNGLTYPIIKLLRIVTKRLPFKINYYISFPLALAYRTLTKIGIVRSEYGKNSKIFTTKQLHNIVLDQLIPSIANYWRKNEIKEMVEKFGFNVESIESVNGNSWSVLAKKLA
jgi:SAM-dependent methyltransferase